MAEEWELVMPYVVVKSVGGAYEDDAFCAGWQCASIDEILARNGHFAGYVYTGVMKQVDLIAMRHNAVITDQHSADEALWTFVNIVKNLVELT